MGFRVCTERYRGATHKIFYLPVEFVFFFHNSGVAASRLGSGCAAPSTQAARMRPLSRAPKEALFLCATGRGRSLGGGFFVHVREPIATTWRTLGETSRGLFKQLQQHCLQL
jgi:hypothetical protein